MAGGVVPWPRHALDCVFIGVDGAFTPEERHNTHGVAWGRMRAESPTTMGSENDCSLSPSRCMRCSCCHNRSKCCVSSSVVSVLCGVDGGRCCSVAAAFVGVDGAFTPAPWLLRLPWCVWRYVAFCNIRERGREMTTRACCGEIRMFVCRLRLHKFGYAALPKLGTGSRIVIDPSASAWPNTHILTHSDFTREATFWSCSHEGGDVLRD